MQDYGHVLCLFCKTGKEQSVAHRISENGVGTAIFPQRIAKRYSKERKAYEEIRTALLPGYVFVYLPDAVPPVNWWSFSGVIRPLGYGEGRRDYLAGSDLAFAQWVWQKEGNISHVKVVQKGDRIEIADGLFSRMRGTIIRVDRRKQTCCVALDTSGIIRQVWLPYELVEPVDAPRAVGPDPNGT